VGVPGEDARLQADDPEVTGVPASGAAQARRGSATEWRPGEIPGRVRFGMLVPEGKAMTDTTALSKSLEAFERQIWNAGNNLHQMASIPWHLGKQYRRKLRLFALACFDVVRPLVSDPRSLAAVAFFERHVEKSGVVGRTGRPAASHLVDSDGSVAAAMCGQSAAQIRLGKWALANGYWPPDYATPAVDAAWKAFEKEIIELLKDVVGDPFRDVTFNPEWRTDTAAILARQMYDSRDFSAMLILADALQDAGCDNEDILSHCRDGTLTHVRGCWVVDLVLGKQ
jgi:hypothetical protein